MFRLDYVVAPSSWLEGCGCAEVDQTGILAMGDYLDHKLVTMTVARQQRQEEQKEEQQQKATYDRRALRIKEVQESLRQAWDSVPALPMWWPVEKREKALQQLSGTRFSAATNF